jgi:hypothetical protein
MKFVDVSSSVLDGIASGGDQGSILQLLCGAVESLGIGQEKILDMLKTTPAEKRKDTIEHLKLLKACFKPPDCDSGCQGTCHGTGVPASTLSVDQRVSADTFLEFGELKDRSRDNIYNLGRAVFAGDICCHESTPWRYVMRCGKPGAESNGRPKCELHLKLTRPESEGITGSWTVKVAEDHSATCSGTSHHIKFKGGSLTDRQIVDVKYLPEVNARELHDLWLARNDGPCPAVGFIQAAIDELRGTSLDAGLKGYGRFQEVHAVLEENDKGGTRELLLQPTLTTSKEDVGIWNRGNFASKERPCQNLAHGDVYKTAVDAINVLLDELKEEVCVYLCMYLCMYACICVCMYLCTYVCIYVCICVYVCACMYAYSRLTPLMCL